MVPPLQPARPPLLRVHACQEAPPPPPPNLRRCDVMLLCRSGSGEVMGSHGGPQIYPLPKQGKRERKRGKRQRMMWRCHQGLEQTTAMVWPSRLSPTPGHATTHPRGPARNGAGTILGSQISVPWLHLGTSAITSIGKSHLLAVSWAAPPGTAPPVPCPARLEVGCSGIPHGPTNWDPCYHRRITHLLCSSTARQGQGEAGTANGLTALHEDPQAQVQVAESLCDTGQDSRPREVNPTPSSGSADPVPHLCSPQRSQSLRCHDGSASSVSCSIPHPFTGHNVLPCPFGRCAAGEESPAPKDPQPMGHVPLHTKGLRQESHKITESQNC